MRRAQRPACRRWACSWSRVEGDHEIGEGDDATDAGRDEREREGPEDRRPDRSDDRAEDEATHLRRRVEPEGLAALVLLGLLDDRAAGRGVVHAHAEAGDKAQDEELHRAVKGQRQERRRRQHDQAGEHQTAARRPIGQPAEERLEDEVRRGPGGEDDAQRRRVDALFGDVERQHGQQGPEPDDGHELGHEDGHDRPPTLRSSAARGRRDRRACRSLEPAGFPLPAGRICRGRSSAGSGAEGRRTWYRWR